MARVIKQSHYAYICSSALLKSYMYGILYLQVFQEPDLSLIASQPQLHGLLLYQPRTAE